MRQAIITILCCVLLTAAAAAAAAPTRFVTDELVINLRTGPGNEYRILERLRTGAAVELLEESGDWARVRTADEQVGWVPTQYLIAQRPAADRLAAAQDQAQQAKESSQQLKQRLADSQQALAQAREKIDSLSSSNETLTQQVDEAREGLNMANENKRLKKEVIDLKRRVQDLVNETDRLADRSRQDWFMVGAGVLFAGMIVGIILTRIRWRKRSSWGDL
ncbi:MAG: TIGR04211 family SH3 domain-containing protein [Ectothiorhodospiraceae bacterium]